MNELPADRVDGYVPDEAPAEGSAASEVPGEVPSEVPGEVPGEDEATIPFDPSQAEAVDESSLQEEEGQTPEQVAEDVAADEIPGEEIEEADATSKLQAEVEAAEVEAAEVEAAEPEAAEPEAAEPVAVPEAEPEPTPALEDAVPAEVEEEPAGPDPFRGPGDWYVVHTYAGYENKVKTNLESRIHTMQMEEKIFDVHIPMEDVMEIKGGKKQVVQRKVFPGYLLVKMVYDNDSWYVVRNTPGVTGFVAAGTGSKPTPLSRREVEKILAVKKEEVKPTFRLGFEEGDVVRIISGPFADFNGTISEINLDQSKLKVLVNIFDRETPVELSFDQVAKV